MADTTRALRRALDELEKQAPGLTIGHALTLLAILEDPGQSVGVYAKNLDVPLSTVSRQLLDLSIGRSGRPGLGFLRRLQDPMNLREINYVVSPKGAAMAQRLAELIMGGTLPQVAPSHEREYGGGSSPPTPEENHDRDPSC